MEYRKHIVDVLELRTFAGTPVRLRLVGGTEHVGVLRTELLSDRSISVFLGRDNGDGETLYIDEIVGIWPRD